MRKFIYRILLVLLCISYTHTARAFVFFDYTPLIPVAPQICAMCTPSAITEVATTISQVNDMRLKFEKYTDISKLKQALVSYAMGVGVTTFNNLRKKLTSKKKVVSSSVILDEQTKVNLEDTDAVKEVMIERFFQYPSKKKGVKKLYQEQGEQLKIDTTIEIYVNVRQMEKELNEQLIELDKIEKCVSGGDGCDGMGMEQYNCQKDGQEDELCLWRNSVAVAEIYDTIMRNIEYLGVLEAQYQAVMAIGKRPEILEYIEEEAKKNKSSSLEILRPKQDFAHHEIVWKMGFAAQSVADEQLAKDWYDGSEEKEVKTTEDGFEIMDGTGGFTGSLSGKKEDFQSMPVIEEAAEKAELAKRAHNMKQNLRSAKKVFDSYEDMLIYHKKIVENLRISEKCIQTYMRDYYANPLSSWMGKDCGYYNNNIYCHYSPEKSVKATGASKGMLDIPCPGMENYKCYLVEMTDTSDRYGLSGYTLGLYLEAKKQEALEDQDAYLLGDDTTEDNVSARVASMGEKVSTDSSDGSDNYITTMDRSKASSDLNKDKEVASQDDIDDEANADRDQYDNGDNPATLKKPSMEESMEAEVRKDGLLNWTIGEIVAKAMVDDLNGGGHSFGDKIRKFPLWNDQQEFYDQYIEGKYGNIREYLEHEPFADILLKVSRFVNENMEYEEDPTLQAKDAEELTDVDKDVDDFEDTSTDIDEIVAGERTELANISKYYKNEIEKKKKKIAAYYVQLDNASEALDEVQTTYNEENSKIKDAHESTPEAEQGLEEGRKLYEGRSESFKSDEPSPIDEDFKKTKEENEKSIAESRVKRETAENTARMKQAEVTRLQDEIKKLKKGIEKDRSDYVLAYSRKLSETKQAVDEALKKRQDEGMGALLGDKVGDIIAMGRAEEMMQCVRQYALEKLDDAMEEIKEMQHTKAIYYPMNIEELRGIHETFITEITENLDVEKILKSTECGLKEEFIEQVVQEEVIEILEGMFGDLCKNDYCTTPEADDVYFVGAYAKRRDFKTPTAPINFASAPLREIFHFDTADYDNVDKYTPYDDEDEDADLSDNTLVTITGESFLSLGGDLPFIYDPEGIARNEGMMPKIWYYILKPLAFEEREFDLLKLVTRGDASNAYLRSGTYPCLIEGRFVRTGADFLLEFVQKDSNMIIQECRGVSLAKDDKHGVVAPCDEESKQCGRCDQRNRYCKNPPEDLVDDSSASAASELANIIDYVPDPDFMAYDPFFHQPIPQEYTRYKLTFNPMLQKAVQIVNDYQNEEDDNGPYKGARRSFLDRNQFGDYLDNIDTEAKATEVMVNLSKKIEEVGDNLEDIFNAFGYTLRGITQTEDGKEVQQMDDVSEDFSLLNPDDYRKAMEMLEGFKTSYMRKAEALLKSVPIEREKATEYVRNEYDKVENVLKVLDYDKDADVLVSGTEAVPDDLEESIKQNKANDGIGEKYEEQRKKDLQDKIDKLVAPYCAVFFR